MRRVEWTDKRGYRHRALVRDEDPDSAAKHGLKLDPPSVGNLDWEGIKKDLHNALLDRGLIDWPAVQKAPRGSLTGAIIAVMRARLIALYRENTIIAPPAEDANEQTEVEP